LQFLQRGEVPAGVLRHARLRAALTVGRVQLPERGNGSDRSLTVPDPPEILDRDGLRAQRPRGHLSNGVGQRLLMERARTCAQAGWSPIEQTSGGNNLIREAFAGTPATIGFRCRTTLDESPETRSKTRLAVARAKEGDHEALRFLYVSYSHNIYGYVRSIVRDDHEAEDITQHVFAKLMTSIVRYDDRGVPFFAWLLRLARNVAIDHIRANRLTPTEEVIDPTTSTGADMDRAETVREALATLPDEQREVVILRHVIGLTPGEIADRLGRSEGSIHGLHHRGRRALQRELERLDSAPFTHAARQLVAA
jgi:RNA polymerase sigma-70 factor, ECF subfamily